ncbi:MAG: DUF748 domain-containing protein [Planctomycetota bacterium]
MNSPATATPEGEPPLAPPTPAGPPGPKSRPRRWRRRLFRAFWIGLGVAIILRIALSLVLPTILARAFAPYRIDAHYESLHLSVLTGDLEVWHLRLLDQPANAGDEPLELAHAEYVRADLSVWQLLRGRLVLPIVEADGADLRVGRDADGGLRWVDRFLAAPESVPTMVPSDAPGASDPSDPVTATTPRSFAPPMEIHALRLQHLHVTVEDEAVSPPLRTRVDLNVRVSDLGSSQRPARVEIVLAGANVLDRLIIELRAQTENDRVAARVIATLEGLRPQPLAGYLEQAGLRPLVERWSGTVTADLELSRASADSRDIEAVLIARQASFAADDAEALGCDRFEVRAVFGAGGVELRQLTVEGARLHAAGGDAIRFAGLRAELGAAGVPSAAISAYLDRATVTPSAAGTPGTWDIALAARAPDVVAGLSATGSFRTRESALDLDLQLAADGIEPTALRGQLAALGLESRFAGGRFACGLRARGERDVDGRWRASAAIENLTLASADEWAGLAASRIQGARYDNERRRLIIESIEIEQPRARVLRDAEGRLNLFGLRLVPPVAGRSTADDMKATDTSTKSAQPAARAPGTEAAGDEATAADVVSRPGLDPSGGGAATRATPATAPLRIELERIRWSGTQLSFEDHAAPGAEAGEPVRVEISDAGVEVSHLVLGGAADDANATADENRTASVNAWLQAPRLIESARLEGTLVTTPSSFHGSTRSVTTGVTAAALQPYLEAAGLTPVLEAGALRFSAEASVANAAWGLRAHLSISDLEFRDEVTDAAPLVAWRTLELGPVVVSPNGIAIETAALRSPRVRLQTLADGRQELLGVRTRTRPTAAAETAPGSVPASDPTPSPTTPAPTEESEIAGDPSPAVTVTVGNVALADLQVEWLHPARAAPLESTIEFELRDLVLGRPAPAATLSASLSVTDVLQSCVISGRVSPGPLPAEPLDLNLVIGADGLRGSELRPLLPPGIDVELTSGRFNAGVHARIEPHELGGERVTLAITDVVLGESGAPPGFALGLAEVRVERLDLAAGVVQVDAIRAAEFELEVEAGETGEVRVAGLRIAPVDATAGTPTESAAGADAPVAPADTGVAPATLPTTPTRRAERTSLPRVELGTLDLGVRRVAVRFADATETLELRDLRLSNPTPWVLLDPTDSEGLAPLQLSLTASVRDLVDRMAVEFHVAPFAREPMLQTTIDVTGIHGAALTRISPTLATKLRTDTLQAGNFHAEFEAILALRRRTPTEFDFGQPFGVTLRLSRAEFRDGDGPILAGVGELAVDDLRFDPTTGGVKIRSLQVQGLASQAVLTKEGLEALGVVIRLPAANEPADETPDGVPVGEPAPPAPDVTMTAATDEPSAGNAAPPRSSPELTIDQIEIVGLDFRIEDRTTDLPMVIPLDDLEILARGLQVGGAGTANKPLRFSVSVQAGKVPLPGQPDSTPVPVFDEFRVTGSLELGPELRGTVKARLEALQLATFRGPAAAAAVDLADGVLDTSVQINLGAAGVLGVDSDFVFTDLDLSEAPGGPIQRFLQLPTPLDAVLFLLRDSTGAITVPLAFRIEEGGVSGAQITKVAVTTLAVLIGNAIAASPFRVVGTAGDLVGLGAEEEPSLDAEETEIEFAAGATRVPEEARAQLDALVDRMIADPRMLVQLDHETGRGDEWVADLRSNPPPEPCLELAAGLQRRIAVLREQRGRLADRASEATFVRSASMAAVAVTELRATEQELGAAERSLDQLLELALGGAEHRARRRAREGCLALARARLAEVAEYLLARGVPKDQVRVKAARYRAAERDGGAWIGMTVERGKS